MIDFRYHVVSLTAVFVALAVGIVLGSGPLRSALVGDMSDTIDALEQDVTTAQEQFAAERDAGAAGKQFADETSGALLTGTLAGANVAVVQVAQPAAQDVADLQARLVQAGATIAAEVTVEPAWTDPDQAAFRSSLATSIAPDVADLASDAPAPEVLATALTQALIPPNGDADASALLWDLLTEAELVTGTRTSEVSAVVLAAGIGADNDTVRADASAQFATLAGNFAQAAQGVTVASGADVSGDVPSAVQNNATASALVSTVVTGLEYYGRISTALVLSENISGSVGHYGPGDGRRLVP